MESFKTFMESQRWDSPYSGYKNVERAVALRKSIREQISRMEADGKNRIHIERALSDLFREARKAQDADAAEVARRILSDDYDIAIFTR